MNEEYVKNELQKLYDNFDEISICVYVVIKELKNKTYKLDIEAKALENLKEIFINSLKKRITNETRVLNLSSCDERTEAIYFYDIEIPKDFAVLQYIADNDNIDYLDLSKNNLMNFKTLLIEIGNNEMQVILYKILAPINIYGRKSFFLKKDKTRLEQLDDEFLRLSENFQLMQINSNLFVIDLKSLEKNFGFYEIIKKEATLGIEKIEEMSLVENINVLKEMLDDIKYARQLTKIAKSSPVIKAKIPNENIIRFCRTYKGLKGRIHLNPLENKILLDTKISKELFIKILMDNFLTSELTKFSYETIVKDSLD